MEQPVTEVLPAMKTIDLELDGSWTFDQFFSSDPSPLSANDLSLSPLWGFSDDNNNNQLNGADDKQAGNVTLTSCGAARRLLSDMKRQLPMPILELNPSEYQDAACLIKERMTKALRLVIDLGEKHVLAQVWAPVKNRGRNVLTTSGQPFVLDPNSNELHRYRMASLMYTISLDDETNGVLELPGRVFKHKLPEWTPNVQFYSEKEYQRLNHALRYNIRGTLALPVFEPSGQYCIGVVELILTSQKINYASEVDNVCKALEAVNLRSSNIFNYLNTQIYNESRQQALAEILEVIAVVCETYNLPLAQTWVPCRHQSVLACGGGFKKSCSSIDGSCADQVCMSTTDVAFYVVDAHMWGFRDACAEHHLQKGQGVVGRAFATRSSCFCENITRFGKSEYPLVHYARLFGLVGSFAICLRSTHMCDDDYVLEFFLPSNMVDCNDQEIMLGSLLTTMKQHFHSFKVAYSEEIGEDGRFVEIVKASVNSDFIDSSIQLIRLSESGMLNGGPNCGKSETIETTKKSKGKQGTAEKSTSFEVTQQHFAENHKDDALDVICVESSTQTETSNFKIFQGKSISPIPKVLDKGKKPMVVDNTARSQGKYKTATISLPREVIEKQFGKTMKEAAKNLHVSLSTLKRKCNVLGISEWPGPNLVKRKANDSYITQIDTNEDDDGAIQNPSNVNMNKNTLIIKAKYADDMLKFHLPISQATFEAVENEIGMRFKLCVGSYKLKYLDEDRDWISLISDEGMNDCIKSSRKIDRIVVCLHVLPSTQTIPNPNGSST